MPCLLLRQTKTMAAKAWTTIGWTPLECHIKANTKKLCLTGKIHWTPLLQPPRNRSPDHYGGLRCPGSSGVEQWIENPRVGGSIPPLGTIIFHFRFVSMAWWLTLSRRPTWTRKVGHFCSRFDYSTGGAGRFRHGSFDLLRGYLKMYPVETSW